MSVGNFCIRNVVTVPPTASVEAAARRMAEENVGAVVVVEGRKPVGIITDRDLVVRVMARGYSPGQTAISTVMTPQPVGIMEHAALEEAMERMEFRRLRRLVVLNEAQEVVGIITLDDLLELWAEERQALAAITSVIRAVRHETI